MGIWVKWDIKNRHYIHYTVEGGWDSEDLTSLFDAALLFNDDPATPMHIILDLARSDPPPLGFPLAPQIKHLLQLMQHQIGIVAIVGDNIMTHNITHVLGGMNDPACWRVYMVDSSDRAREIIAAPPA